jgi:hypothetical protein
VSKHRPKGGKGSCSWGSGRNLKAYAIGCPCPFDALAISNGPGTGTEGGGPRRDQGWSSQKLAF